MFRIGRKVEAVSDAVSDLVAKDASRSAWTIYHMVCILVKLLKVSPASSAEAERSFNALRRLKTWLRTTMTETRL